MKDPDSRFPLYAMLLKLYPVSYRRRYERQMLQTTADMLDEAGTPMSRLAIWARLSIDLPVNVARQQISYGGVAMRYETPGYIKRNSVVAGVMLLPFLAALLANATNKLVYGRDLYQSWLWSFPVLRVWVFFLPAIAFLLAAGTYLSYTFGRTKVGKRRTSWLRRAADVRHAWPILAPTLLAFGILLLLAFHDSVHCWTGNPLHTITHAGHAWQCTEQNQSLGGFRRSL